MSKKILITGGAGFIGSHLADELVENGYKVTVLDNLNDQVHGGSKEIPSYLNKNVEFILGDVRDSNMVRRALKGVDAVYHFAAAVGVGQSMYQISRYTEINNQGTAVLLENLIGTNVEKLLVASSMSIYGEGLYISSDGKCRESVERNSADMKNGKWELGDGNGGLLSPVPTPESKRPALSSIYALSKYNQERMSLMIGKAYGIKTAALRFFNVYGTRQSLNNPYTGVLAIFASRLLNDKQPFVFEDGYQKRDFVSVKDVSRACRLALEKPIPDNMVLNVGSGECCSVLEVAQKISEVLGKEHLTPIISKKFRVGDIRHCFSDISLASEIIGYKPQVKFSDGLSEMARWLEGQIACDNIECANAELVKRGLAI
ncbi:UDP-glucose 4-epimerase [Chitinispirillum alkaliphilum]|nr:UDP-glucose 4-epimerase [Chitinispirillum alkaliphilum]